MKKSRIYSLTLLLLLLSACSTKNVEPKVEQNRTVNVPTNNVSLGTKIKETMNVGVSTPPKSIQDKKPKGDMTETYSGVQGDFQNNYELMDFIEMMVTNHNFKRDYLTKLFSNAKDYNLIPKVRNCSSSIINVGGAWDRYRNCFIYEKNIRRGVEFWNRYENALNRAEAKYGVPAKYIIGILGIETAYGVNFGKYRVLDVLTTRSMLGDRRANFYRDELEKYLLIGRDIGLDMVGTVGSTSGALGYGQFMPSSYMRFAVDFNSDGRKDLWDAEDAIGSIANYFAKNGWRRSIPKVAVRAKYKGNRFNRLKTGYKTRYSLSKLKKKYGIYPREKFVPYGKVSLIKLPRANYDELWLGSPNFRVITTYNHDTFYGMTVFELGEIVAKRRNGEF